MAAKLIKCSKCNGERLVDGLFKKSPCIKCNGLGRLKPNNLPFIEFEVIAMLLNEIAEKNTQIHLLQKNQKEINFEEHDGRSSSNYRGD